MPYILGVGHNKGANMIAKVVANHVVRDVKCHHYGKIVTTPSGRKRKERAIR